MIRIKGGIMKVAVLVEDHYQVLEVWYPYLRLREEGIETVLLAPKEKGYLSKEGYPAEAEMSTEKAGAEEFDGVVIPGGYAPDILRRHESVNSFVRDMHKEGKMVAAICHGGWVLVSAGVLKGKKATCFLAIKDDIVNAGAVFEDRETIVDGNLITARNPYDLPSFCMAMIKFLKK
jgi:protease I